NSDNNYINTYLSENNISDIVTSLPSVGGEDKRKVLEGASVFILTSRHEGHSMAVLEALAYGIPCILSTGTNVSAEISSLGAGWEVETNSNSIAEGLVKAIKDREQWVSMGDTGRAHAQSNYEWTVIGKKLLKEYKNII